MFVLVLAHTVVASCLYKSSQHAYHSQLAANAGNAAETASNRRGERRQHQEHASVCPGSTANLASEQTRSPAEFDWPAVVPRASKCLHSPAYPGLSNARSSPEAPSTHTPHLRRSLLVSAALDSLVLSASLSLSPPVPLHTPPFPSSVLRNAPFPLSSDG